MPEIYCGMFLLITLDSSNNSDSFKLTMISSFSAYRQLCPPGCTSCSAINGCITCQPNLFLFLARSGMRQQGICTHSCPTGYYGVRRHNYSICYSESIPFNGNSLPVSHTLQNWPRVSTIVHIHTFSPSVFVCDNTANRFCNV